MTHSFKRTITFVSLFIFLFGLSITPALADNNNVNFEPPTYHTGSIDGQDAWTALGSAGAGCAVYDQAVASQSVYPSFATQSFRISDAVTSGCFGDQAFAKPLVNAVGEADSTAGTFSEGTLQRHFEMQFDIASVVPSTPQLGLHISVSPDRGDGSRMSYLRFEDNAGGLDVFFDDVQGASNPANFVETKVGTGLDRTVPHKIKLTMDMYDGPSNDVVKVYIDGNLVHTGTSWENYYRYDSESSSEQSPRIVKTVIFRSSGTANPLDSGKGFYVDNLSLLSGPTPTVVPPIFDASSQANAGSKTHISWNHTTTTQNDRLLMVGVSTDGAVVNSVTYGTQSLTKLSAKDCPHSFTCRDELWYVVNPTSGTHTVSINLASSANVVAGGVTFSNVDTSNVFGTVGINNGDNKLATVNVTTTSTQTVLDALAGNGNASWVNDSSQTKRWGNNTLNDGKGSTKPGIAGTTTMKWTNSQTDDWAEIAVPINGEVLNNTSSSLVLSNLSVNDSTNASSWSLRTNIQSGDTLYGDSSIALASLPSQLAGSAWIRTANGSKNYFSDPVASFSINQSATVYVGLDTRATVPSWIDGSWTNSGLQLTDNESTPATFTLYKKVFPAGTVSLGHNSDTKSFRDMFTVIVQ